ncbi:MAG: hypothetical protein HGA45_36600, partial [Chloroflexales bacterium]|nr:hypothetical protein [Chloroflexales bacterium]
PADPEPAWRRQLNNVLETQITRYPFLVQVRAVWRQLQDERESWPILLPVLAAVFFLVYRRERKLVEAIIRDVAD